MSEEPKCSQCGHPDECRNEQRAQIAELTAALRPFVFFRDLGYVPALDEIDRWIEKGDPLCLDAERTTHTAVGDLLMAREVLEAKR